MSVQITRRQISDSAINNAKIAADAAIASTKLANWSADRNAGGYKLTGLASGTAASDAVTKAQLDSAVTASAAGLAIKAPVRLASTANVSGSYTATAGASGRGQFTGMPNALDGVNLAANDRVLLKDQSTGAQNGLWVVTTLGSGSNGVWDRATDADSDEEVTDGTFVFVGEGTANAGTSWVLTTNESITVGGASGTALTFVQFGGGISYTADGTTITLGGNQFSVTSGGIGATQLASNAVTTAKILDANVTTAKLANDAVTQDKIADDAVGADQLASNAVVTASIVDSNVTTAKIADSNVTTAKIANDAVTQDKIADDAVGADQLASNAVVTASIVDGNVTTAKIADLNVTTGKIADLNVTTAKLADANVTTAKLADANVTTAKLANDSVTGAKVAWIAQTVTGTVNGSNPAFTTSAAAEPDSLIVWVNGIRQRPTTDFTYSGSTITFGTAPETGDNIAVFGVIA